VDTVKSYSVFDISDWFLSKESMTPKKLQKLTYYAEAWGWALFDRSVINDDNFEAWVHGPVSPKLYDQYRSYGWNQISKKTSKTAISEEIENLLESVWVTYGDKSANELEALTHTEIPWKNARVGYQENENSNVQIKSQDMREFYLSIYNGD